MPTDPYAGLDKELAALQAAVSDYFDSLSSLIPDARINAGLQTGASTPLIHTKQWQKAANDLMLSVRVVEVDLLTLGLSQGIDAISFAVPALSARIGELADLLGGQQAISLAQSIDAATRLGLQRSIGTASRIYTRDQSLATLRQLRSEVRSMIGLTPKQAARIEAWRTGAEAAGLEPDAILAGVEERSASAIEVRAEAIADRGVIESVSYGRHQSWVEGVKSGDIPATAKKVWRTQADKAVRPTHRAQAAVGPIPLGARYQIMDVLHPPSKERGCRCFENIVID